MKTPLILAIIALAIACCTVAAPTVDPTSTSLSAVTAISVPTLTSSPEPTGTPPPYNPQLSDYLIAVDDFGMWDRSKGEDIIGRNIWRSAFAKFEIVKSMYWLDGILLDEEPSPEGFREFVPKAFNMTAFGRTSRVNEYALAELQMLTALAMDKDHREIINNLVWTPSDGTALMICVIGVQAISGFSDLGKTLYLPPEPMCPLVIADYRAYGTESELGFLGHMDKLFYLGLLPGSEFSPPPP